MKRVPILLVLLFVPTCTTQDSPTQPQFEDLTLSIAQLAYDCTSQTQIPTAECEALTALYTSTNGPGWTNNAGWLATPTPCSWYGVGCGSGSVTVLNLFRNQLSGPLPPELGVLAHLESLDFFGNSVSGSIPAELGSLGALQILNLTHNQLSGGVPAELGNLTNLRVLYAFGNQISGPIPADLGNLAALQYLSFGANQLSGPIPPELGALTGLLELNFNWNQLSGGVPPELGNLVNLQNVGLDGNQLTGRLPGGLGNWMDLRSLFLSGNQLSGLFPLSLAEVAGEADCRARPGNDALYIADTQSYRNADSDGDGFICGLGLTGTWETVFDDMVGGLETLVADGVLNSGQGNSLAGKLEQAEGRAEKGQYKVSINVANAFINHVNDLMAAGVVAPAEGQPLIEMATVLIELWSEML